MHSASCTEHVGWCGSSGYGHMCPPNTLNQFRRLEASKELLWPVPGTMLHRPYVCETIVFTCTLTILAGSELVFPHVVYLL